MDFNRRTCFAGIACAAAAALITVSAVAPSTAQAQAFPNRPITLVVPVAPGGTNDAVSRIIGQGLSKHLGVPVIVENRPGAAGIVGLQSVIKAAPDGYTLVMAGGNVLSILPVLDKKLPYNVDDIAPISLISQHPFFLYASNDSGITSVRRLIEIDKEKPGSISYASHGQGSTAHLCAELLSQITGVKMVHIPYKGGSQALPDITSGRTQLMFETEVAMPLAVAGKLKAVAVSRGARMPAYPNIPTFQESGYPNFNWQLWFALVGPKGIPQAVQDKLNDAIRKTVAEPGFLETQAAKGFDFVPKSGAELRQFIAEQTQSTQRLVSARSITLAE